MFQVERSYQVEDVSVSGHEVDLIAVPYNQPVVVRDRNPRDDTYGPPYREAWSPGAFRNVVKAANRVTLAAGTHKAAWARELNSYMGQAVELTERDTGLRGRFRVTDGPFGQALVAALTEGKYRGVSIGAGILRSKVEGGVTYRTLATLDHVLLTDSAQIPGSEVLAVRDDPNSVLARYWAKYHPE